MTEAVKNVLHFLIHHGDVAQVLDSDLLAHVLKLVGLELQLVHAIENLSSVPFVGFRYGFHAFEVVFLNHAGFELAGVFYLVILFLQRVELVLVVLNVLNQGAGKCVPV